MSRWKQLVEQPKGALPGGIVTKAGIVLIAVLVGGLLFSGSLTGPEEDATVPGSQPEAQAVDEGMGRALEGRIRAEAERQTQQAALQARAELARRQAAASDEPGQAETEGAAAKLAQTIQSAQGSFADLTANGNLSRAHVSRCVHWQIGWQVPDMPPELPQTCR